MFPRTYKVHKNLSIISGTGGALALFGISGYFMAFDYPNTGIKRKQTSKVVAGFGILLYLIGIVLLILSVGVYRDQREDVETEISSIIQQVRKQENQPHHNEPFILASLASLIILLGLGQSLRTFHNTEKFGLVGLTVYTVGWVSNAFAASMQNNSISSINNQRLVWTLPGAIAIVLGTACLPWQIRHKYVSGVALPLSAIGYAFYTIGNAIVHPKHDNKN
jgi:hypothetical protein